MRHVVYKIIFQYASSKKQNKAALSFHLSQNEKKDIIISAGSASNVESFQKVKQVLSMHAGKTITIE